MNLGPITPHVPKQQRLPFPKPTETQIERCRRVLSLLPAGAVVRASELRFDYEAATVLATRQEAER